MNQVPAKAGIVSGVLLLSSLFANDVNTGGQLGVVRTLSASTIGQEGIIIGGVFKFATDPSYVKGPDGSGPVMQGQLPVSRTDPADLLSYDVFTAFGLSGICDISVDLPVYEDITGFGLSSTGLGDLEVAAKLKDWDKIPGAFCTQAYYLKVMVPTGSTSQGFFPRHSYYLKNDSKNSGLNAFSGGALFFNPVLVWTFDFNRLSHRMPVLLHANFGGVLGKSTYSTAVTAALALEVRAARSLTLFTELTGESRIKHYGAVSDSDLYSTGAFAADPVRLTSGFRLDLPRGFYCILAGDIGLSDDNASFRTNWNREGYRYSTRAVPRWGGQVTFGWAGRARTPDRDHDGIPDSIDKCPDVPEDIDGFEDADGCPDYDNDKDGIPDSIDKCPDIAEDIDGFEDADGCPDYDNDKDGVPDSVDKCPNFPEDYDKFQDADGCPDYDNDKDGVPDSVDKCPDVPEDIDGFEDADGCPDYDNDKDGVPDTLDKCPMTAGTAANSGCPGPSKPKAEETRHGPLILNGVMFESGKAVLTAVSRAVLDQVALSLQEWIEVKLEIQGHCDNTETGLNLSQQRAEAVRDYLIQKGVAADRLKAMGYGSLQPIGNNATAAGRSKNRRVELHRID